MTDFKAIKPDVRILLLQVLLSVVLLSSFHTVYALWALFSVLALATLFFCGWRSFFKNILLFAVLNGLFYGLTALKITVLSDIFPPFLTLLIRVAPAWLTLTILNARSRMDEMLYALDRMHIPKTLSIPLMVVYRYGHCGILCGHDVDNDKTLEVLAKTALSHVQAGADMVAPSDMMDGRVGRIRQVLDENGFVNTPIMAYSVKYASAFYGPFRDAAGSAPAFGDRKSYQMDPHNAREALLEAELDVQEGADILMVKPGMAYLDVLKSLKEQFRQPVALYSVSGEYAMIQAAAAAGYIDREAVICESAVCMYRAGADLLITYFAMELAKYIREGRIG